MIDWLAELIHPLLSVVFTMAGEPVTWVELLGFLTGGACVALTVGRNVWNFPVGIANCGFFLLLFVSARLWADAGLQIVFITLGAAGWWQWVRHRADRAALVVTHASGREMMCCLGFLVIGTAVLTGVLHATHDSAPFLDAVTTCLSLVAQWLLNGKRIQTWYFWIVADCIYIPLYLSKDLNLTAVVYASFLALCVAGLRSWLRAATSEAHPNQVREARVP